MNNINEIKTFSNAFAVLNKAAIKKTGTDHPLCYAYHSYKIDDANLIAYIKLRIIHEALNLFNTVENGRYKYYPHFSMYSKESLDRQSKEWIDSHAIHNGLVFDLVVISEYALSSMPEVFAFNNNEIAKYFGEQFIDIWYDYFMIRK